jgi:hypothetical protein
MLSSNVLVLNRSYIPVNITTVRRAFILLYQELAKVVGKEFETFDFQSWSELAEAANEDHISLVDGLIRVPRVVVLTAFDRIPKRIIRFSRLNIYLRDKNTCQYCRKEKKRADLNLDHVIPRTQGGKTTWENVVACCLRCNHVKGGRRPAEAGMKLARKPIRPKWTPFIEFSLKQIKYHEWKPFLSMVDYSYWNLELKEE